MRKRMVSTVTTVHFHSQSKDMSLPFIAIISYYIPIKNPFMVMSWWYPHHISMISTIAPKRENNISRFPTVIFIFFYLGVPIFHYYDYILLSLIIRLLMLLYYMYILSIPLRILIFWTHLYSKSRRVVTLKNRRGRSLRKHWLLNQCQRLASADEEDQRLGWPRYPLVNKHRPWK